MLLEPPLAGQGPVTPGAGGDRWGHSGSLGLALGRGLLSKRGVPLPAQPWRRGWEPPGNELPPSLPGPFGKPSLSALPSPVVTSGGVTLQCASYHGFNRFLLTKEGEDAFSRTLDGERRRDGQTQALFPVGPVTPDTGGRSDATAFTGPLAGVVGPQQPPGAPGPR